MVRFAFPSYFFLNNYSISNSGAALQFFISLVIFRSKSFFHFRIHVKIYLYRECNLPKFLNYSFVYSDRTLSTISLTLNFRKSERNSLKSEMSKRSYEINLELDWENDGISHPCLPGRDDFCCQVFGIEDPFWTQLLYLS